MSKIEIRLTDDSTHTLTNTDLNLDEIDRLICDSRTGFFRIKVESGKEILFAINQIVFIMYYPKK